ncbi:MAG: exodeoxyribonuclease VII large subunit [Acidimicrobiales bacterium]|nr:exodeoxyribonuclease VII large subunit [Acidimicrobiales bacterium]
MSLFDDPDVGAIPEPTWSVTELADRIGNVLRAAFRDEVWVRGEVRDLSRPSSGHVYFTLTEPGDDGGACLSVMLSSRNKAGVNAILKRAGGRVRITDGTDVRIRGRLDWYLPRGQLQLRMTSIDPAHTLGQLEVARAELIARLTEEGLLAANAARPMPLVPLRIGLVTSRGSAAEADFVEELRSSGFAFDLVRIDTRVQGLGAPLEIAAAIAEAAAGGVDVVALVRGGGARTDLMAFDDERVARAIAACPVPVVTGIGHEIDRSVADEVAHTSHKTPTACAQGLASSVAEFSMQVSGLWAAIAGRATRDVADQERWLGVVADRVRRGATSGLLTAQRRLDGHGGRVAGAARAHVRAGDSRAEAAARRLVHRAPRALAEAERVVTSTEARVRANDPERTLARGWSITRSHDGRLVRSPDDVAAGDDLVTLLAGGEVRSTVIPPSTVADDG